LVSNLVAFHFGRGARKKQFCVIPVFWARWALSVAAGILHSFSGYDGCRPWLLAAGPHPQRPGKRKTQKRAYMDNLRGFLLFVPSFAGQSSPEALKARDRRVTPAAAARRFIQRITHP